MIEGVLMFAGSVARRIGAWSTARAVFPCSVESVAVGYGSGTASEETSDGSRAELWLPLRQEPFTLAETRSLFAEGRAQLGRHQARNAVEFALAINLLSVNRGVKAFTRYGFLKRNGRNYLATPLGRMEVTLRPRATLLQDEPMVRWIDAWRRACRDKGKTPARYQVALRRIDRAMFAFTNRSERSTHDPRSDAPFLLDILAALGQAERTLATGQRFAAEKHLPPLVGLMPQWLHDADDGSSEFRLAAGLASLPGFGREVGPFRAFLEPVRADLYHQRVE